MSGCGQAAVRLESGRDHDRERAPAARYSQERASRSGSDWQASNLAHVIRSMRLLNLTDGFALWPRRLAFKSIKSSYFNRLVTASYWCVT